MERLLSNLDTESFRSRDEEEVAGYAYVMEEVFTSYEYIPLTKITSNNYMPCFLNIQQKIHVIVGITKNFLIMSRHLMHMEITRCSV